MEIIRDINKLTKLKSESFYRLKRGTFFIRWEDFEKKGIDKASICIKTRDDVRENALNLMNRRTHCISENEECYVLDDVKIIISVL